MLLQHMSCFSVLNSILQIYTDYMHSRGDRAGLMFNLIPWLVRTVLD